jgi:hypothetical protein
MKYQGQLIATLFFIVFVAVGMHIVVDEQTKMQYSPSPQQKSDIVGYTDGLRENLPHGELYYTIPEKMKVGVKKTIVAGIAPEITENIKKQLVGQGKYTIKKGVPFNPQWVNMELKVNPEEFKKFLYNDETQVVTTEQPGKWQWDLTPIKKGEFLITLQATTISLNDCSNNPTKFIIPVFEKKIKVNVNMPYSAQQILSENWSKLLGSGGISGALGWWLKGKFDRSRNPS